MLSDVEDAIESTPGGEVFHDATRIELAAVSDVRHGGSLQSFGCSQLSFGHDGLEYSVLGSDELLATLLKLLDHGNGGGSDRGPPEPVDDR